MIHAAGTVARDTPRPGSTTCAALHSASGRVSAVHRRLERLQSRETAKRPGSEPHRATREFTSGGIKSGAQKPATRGTVAGNEIHSAPAFPSSAEAAGKSPVQVSAAGAKGGDQQVSLYVQRHSGRIQFIPLVAALSTGPRWMHCCKREAKERVKPSTPPLARSRPTATMGMTVIHRHSRRSPPCRHLHGLRGACGRPHDRVRSRASRPPGWAMRVCECARGRPRLRQDVDARVSSDGGGSLKPRPGLGVEVRDPPPAAAHPPRGRN
jgi:hypothetical protein